MGNRLGNNWVVKALRLVKPEQVKLGSVKLGPVKLGPVKFRHVKSGVKSMT